MHKCARAETLLPIITRKSNLEGLRLFWLPIALPFPPSPANAPKRAASILKFSRGRTETAYVYVVSKEKHIEPLREEERISMEAFEDESRCTSTRAPSQGALSVLTDPSFGSVSAEIVGQLVKRVRGNARSRALLLPLRRIARGRRPRRDERTVCAVEGCSGSSDKKDTALSRKTRIGRTTRVYVRERGERAGQVISGLPIRE